MPQVRVAVQVPSLSVVVYRRGDRMVRRREPLLAISHCISKNDGVVVITGHHTIVLWTGGGNWLIDLDEHIRTVHNRINQSIATDCRSFQTQLT